MYASTMDWRMEMNNMLAKFDQQVTISLGIIEMSFRHGGLSFNDEFQQYFLQASNARIKETYDQFKVNLLLKNQVPIYAPNYSTDNFQRDINDPVEIIDSSDEEDQADNHVKMELMETPSSVRYDGYDIPPESNGGGQTDNEGSYTDEMPKLNLNGIDNVVKMNDDMPLIVGTHREIETNARTSAIKLSNGTKVVGVANMTGRSMKNAKKRAAPGSIAKSISSKQLGGKKGFKCQLCEYSSNKTSNLNQHMRTHTGEKPFRCDICRKGFTTLQSMKKHKVTHNAEIPFHCHGCFTGFSQKSDQAAHEKVCKLRRYECHICKKYITVVKAQLNSHMRKHNGEKPFRCEICMMRFTIKGNLKKHLDAIHTRINP